MCYKAPKAPAVQPAPTRGDVQGDVTAQRVKLANQSGVTGNIFTSALGDTGYGRNVQSQLATIGGGAPQR
jgi:hypothetical protein